MLTQFQWTPLKPRIAIWLSILLVLPACTPPPEQARRQLEKEGIAPTSASAVEAARLGKVASLELLRTAGVNLAAAPDPQSPTPLIAAIQANSGAILLLLSATPDQEIDTLDPSGRSALSYSVESQAPGLATAILEKSANPAKSSHPRQNMISDAIDQKNADLAAKLIANYPPADPILNAALITATSTGASETVPQLLARQADPNHPTPEGNSLLEIAAHNLDLPILTQLIAAGAKAPASAATSPNPLRHAVAAKNLAIAQLLIKAGYRPDDHDGTAGSATGLAASQPCLPLLELFLQNGAAAQPHFQSALIGRDLEIMDLLVKHDAQINDPDAAGDPPLVQTVMKKDLEMTQWLLDHQAPPDTTGQLGQPAFSLALVTGPIALIEAFLNAGANANATFLSPAKQEFLDLTDDEYFNKWMTKDELLTPLMLAASRGDLPLMRLLLKHGAKRGSQTKNWKRYPVNFACEQSHIPAAQLLLGRDPDSERDVRAIVSLSKQRAYIYKDGEVVRSSDISSGKTGFTTPSGKYVISDKQADWKSSIYKVPMPLFMRLSCKDFGLHAGVVRGGSPASHGCVRLPKDQAAAFFSVMEIGDPVIIEN